MSFRKGRPVAATSADQSRAARTHDTRRSIYDTLSIAVIAVLVVLVCATFRDYGITTDEYVQQVYGEKLWAYFLSGFRDQSAFHLDNLHLYGGLFDMVAVALQHVLPMGIYDVRHLLSGLVGVLGVGGVWRLGREIGGPRVGFLATAMLALSASWYGAMFNNTKDIPFAVGMTWMLYLTCRIIAGLPRPHLPHVLWFGLIAGLTLGQRFGGALAFLYLAIAILVYLFLTSRRSGLRAATRDGFDTAVALLPALPVAYAVMGFFWPWSMLSPLNPLRAVVRLTEWPFRTEFGGIYYPADDLPWTYLPSYLAIKIPEVVLFGLLLLIGFGTVRMLRQRLSASNGFSLSLLTVVSAVLVPLVYVLAAQPAFYNGMRHFFFVLPPLYTLAALGLDQLWRETERRPRWVMAACVLLLAAAAAREARTMIDLHPHEYVYFNALVGGTRGAYRNYELDYWSNFVPEAIEQLKHRIQADNNGKRPSRVYMVGVCNAPRALDKFDIPYLRMTQDWKQADFLLPTTNGDCDLFAGGRTIIEVSRDGAVLGVVKDRRPGMTAQGTTTAAPIR